MRKFSLLKTSKFTQCNVKIRILATKCLKFTHLSNFFPTKSADGQNFKNIFILLTQVATRSLKKMSFFSFLGNFEGHVNLLCLGWTQNLFLEFCKNLSF